MELAAGASAPDDRLRVTVAGASMSPTLRPGDVIFVRPGPLPDPLQGTLVTFLTDYGPVTHRAVDLAPGGRIVTKGDHSRQLDAAIPLSRIVGIVVAVAEGEKERPLLSDPGAVRTARLSLLEGRFTARFKPEQRGAWWFKAANLPFRLLVSLSAQWS